MPPKKQYIIANGRTGTSSKKPPPSGTLPPSSDDAPKPPTVSEIIGGKSWTGKLPQTLFYEHCVRSGWEKPVYDNPRRTPTGLLTTVHIGLKNARTGETEKVSFTPPTTLPNGDILEDSTQPTPLESRHMTATYVLHRVSNMKNVHHMLPPTHKRYWALLEDLRKEEVKAGKAWRYEADPFAVKREYETARAQKEAARIEGGHPAAGAGSAGQSRGWQKVPAVDMSSARRKETEDMIRRHHVWNPHGVELTPKAKEEILVEITKLGFRMAHAKEACEWVKDKEEALEWLLIHVPEDDVPARFLPENYSAGITMSAADLGAEYAAKRLAAAGYSLDLCREVLMKNGGEEDRAAQALMEMLVYGKQISPAGPAEEDLLLWNNEPVDDTVWCDEQLSLEAIYGEERFTKISDTVSKITLDLQSQDTGKAKNLPKIILEVRKPIMYNGAVPYPNALPTFAIFTESGKKLPAYIRLSIIRRTAEYAETLKGEQMIYSVLDWLENEILHIIEKPGRLRDLATAVTGSDESREQPSESQQKRRRRWATKGPIDWTPGSKESVSLLRAWEARHATRGQEKMLMVRRSLPAWQLREDIVKAVNTAQVVIISGETGSGKSTQLVQFVLDDLIQRQLGAVTNVFCTQPRRISALGLADRVSDERCQQVGQEIGYAIRGESKLKPGVTKVTFMTTGVLLRRLQMGDTLDDVSHIVVDEVHERSLDTDFLLILIKRIIARRKDLKIILMSATLDADVFARYFGGDEVVQRVNIEGRTFPVTDYYLDEVIKRTGFTGSGRAGVRQDDDDLGNIDPSIGMIIRGLGDRINYNLIAATVMHIDERLEGKNGGILIFLPGEPPPLPFYLQLTSLGTMEIQRCIEAIRTLPSSYTRYHILPLHASLHPSDQRRVFPVPPKGLRKVIAATNVAETSITIEDIVCVIDTGRVKETSYDAQNSIVKLEETWISRAAAKQRRGRAGRVRAGECYKLYTRNAESQKMPERPEPELKRVPLEQTCLGVKSMGIKDVRAFLEAAISPPATVAVESALQLLEKMGAIVGDELSALGRHMALIPADLRCSKLMVYGVLFGCLNPAVTIASILTAKSPFVSPMDKREASKAARVSFAHNQGDLLADCRAWEQWDDMRKTSTYKELRAWCDENFLNHHIMLDIASNRSQYLNSLHDTGFLPFLPQRSDVSVFPELDRNVNNDILLCALIAGAFTPQIARIQLPEQKFASSSTGSLAVDPEARTIKYFTMENGRVFIHPSSTMFEAQNFPGNARFLTYFNKMATSKVFLRDVAPVNAYSLLLFGGKVEVDTLGRGITVDGWVRLRGWGRIGILVQRLRAMLDSALEVMIDNPDPRITVEKGNDEVVRCVIKLIEGDGT
jgi:ATP-dependent RNA helicase DHX57